MKTKTKNNKDSVSKIIKDLANCLLLSELEVDTDDDGKILDGFITRARDILKVK